METDFLNFHDEEHFSSALYQNDLLDDSQSSLLDIVGDYRHEEYTDNVVWDQDVERELNGDLAVIPMSGQINTFPKLSNSPPSKDFQKIFSDWQHLSSIEATTSEDLNSDLHLSNPIDILDCFQPATVSPPITIAAEPVVSSPKSSSIISSFDFSNTQIPVKKEIKNVRKIGGKNLELLKKVIKEENDSFKTDLNSSDELDPSNFDITSYVNGDDDLLIKKEIINEENDLEISEPQEDLFEPELKPVLITNDKPVKSCKKELFGVKTEIKTIENIKEEKKIEDPEEDVDVETVSEQIPVLEARDLNSLLEQFEATEAVNPIFDPPTTNQNSVKIPTPDCKKQITNDPKQKVKQLNSELKQPNNKQKTVSVELLQKIRASATKKIVNVIPARPSKKIKTKVMVDKCKIQKSLNEMIQIDHDYCSPVKSDTNGKKINSPNDKKLDEDNKKIIDDTAIRIGKQIKNAINNENLKKPIKKEKVMISLLKTNFNKNTIINTINTNDEKIQNIIVTENSNCKKRKLNLEEYKKLRGEILKSSESSRQNSPLTSGTNSPLPQTKTVEYQELIMKMASEILKTNAKTKQPTIETKLEEFIPPEIKIEKPTQPEVTPPKINENYQMKTIVSIGVNTNESWLKTIEHKPPKNKIDEIITPILQNTNCKINSNSLIANITETLMQQSPKISPRSSPKINEEQLVHGEDKTVIILNKNEDKPVCRSVGVQTDKICRNYRQRRDSSSSSDDSKKTSSLRNSSISSYSRSRTKSRTRSRSRSRSRSTSHSEYSSYSSDSSRSRSKSRSVSPRRFSRNRYRSRRSRSNSYRGNYRHSRSPYSRSRSRRRRERESIERERMREVEERRVIYVGKINNDTTRADLRRRFQNFGPITNVSVHFREHGDNYGFVTFAYKMDAYEAVERGNEDPNLPKYDISFGGRRAFCKTRYSDLDNIEAESMNATPIFRREEDSFDILLREVQAKLRKRKV